MMIWLKFLLTTFFNSFYVFLLCYILFLFDFSFMLFSLLTFIIKKLLIFFTFNLHIKQNNNFSLIDMKKIIY